MADTPGPVAVSDLPSLADQIGVGADEAPAVLGADLMATPRLRKPPRTPIRGASQAGTAAPKRAKPG